MVSTESSEVEGGQGEVRWPPILQGHDPWGQAVLPWTAMGWCSVVTPQKQVPGFPSVSTLSPLPRDEPHLGQVSPLPGTKNQLLPGGGGGGLEKRRRGRGTRWGRDGGEQGGSKRPVSPHHTPGLQPHCLSPGGQKLAGKKRERNGWKRAWEIQRKKAKVRKNNP